MRPGHWAWMWYSTVPDSGTVRKENMMEKEMTMDEIVEWINKSDRDREFILEVTFGGEAGETEGGRNGR